VTWHHEACHRDLPGDVAALPALLHRLRESLADESSALPGQQLTFGRPHASARTRFEPRYSRTGERIAGVRRIPPDCRHPIKGRCECRPDGTWRASPGAVRADATVHDAAIAPADRVPSELAGRPVWVDEVYEHGPDGLWRCRKPVRRALERLRGSSVRAWMIAIRLLRGDPLATVWGSHGTPPDPMRDATRLLAQLENWAKEERQAEWERRPRQWWDRRRDANARSVQKSESQATAERATSVQDLDSSPKGAATLRATGARVEPSPVSGIGRRRVEQPSGTTGARVSGIPFARRTREEHIPCQT
jgi:hypothetical protein